MARQTLTAATHPLLISTTQLVRDLEQQAQTAAFDQGNDEEAERLYTKAEQLRQSGQDYQPIF